MHIIYVQTPCFTYCTACSAPIVAAYKAGGYSFVQQVCANSSILEDISGITNLKSGISDEMLESMEMDDYDDDMMGSDENEEDQEDKANVLVIE